MKTVKTIKIKRFTDITIIMLCFFMSYSLFSQTTENDKNKGHGQIDRSPFVLGLGAGYVGLFANSTALVNLFDRDYVNGFSYDLFIEYKLNQNSALHLSFDFQELNLIKTDNVFSDKTESNFCSRVGYKYNFYSSDNLVFYILPSAGMWSGLEDRFMGTFNIGTELNSRNLNGFSLLIQLGYATILKNDSFIMFSTGIKYNF